MRVCLFVFFQRSVKVLDFDLFTVQEVRHLWSLTFFKQDYCYSVPNPIYLYIYLWLLNNTQTALAGLLTLSPAVESIFKWFVEEYSRKVRAGKRRTRRQKKWLLSPQLNKNSERRKKSFKMNSALEIHVSFKDTPKMPWKFASCFEPKQRRLLIFQ